MNRSVVMGWYNTSGVTIEGVKETDQDPYVSFRDDNSPHWMIIRQVIENCFEDHKIPDDLKPHIIEWTNLRGQLKTGELPREEFNNIYQMFGDAHNELFNNCLFVSAIRIITNKIPVAG